MKRVALKLHRLSADALLTLAREIRNRMTANADVFTTPGITMADLANLINNLQEAQQAMILGGIAATLHRDEMRKLLEHALTLLAGYVEITADGDVDVITLAGMTPRAQGPRRYDSVATPVVLKAEIAGGGQILLRWKKVAHAKAYTVESCMDPITDAGWRTVAHNSTTNALIGGLTRGKDYWFRVRAIGTQGVVSNWSDVVLQVVA